MLPDIFKAVILGVCAAVFTLFLQSPFAHTETLGGILGITLLEEIVRCGLLATTFFRGIFTKNVFSVGLSFGIGFALTESLMMPSFDIEHIALLFILHSTLSLLVAWGCARLNIVQALLACIGTLLIHATYNTIVFLSSVARF